MSTLRSQEINASDVKACGAIVGGEQYWDIEGERISEDELRRWIVSHLPEGSCWANGHTMIVTYHVVAYAHRRRAISDFMKTVNWSAREVSP